MGGGLVDPQPFDVILLVAGLAVLGAMVLPRLLDGRLVSFPIAYVLLGAAVFLLPLGLEVPDPREQVELFERLSEVTVIVALMGVGLKLDRPFGWRRWSATWRLLGVTMPLTIAAVLLLGVWGLGFAWPIALLVAASLAPTDPVLAADVQVAGVYQEHEDEARFALTSEAGLNDGLAFPFTNAAIAMAVVGADPSGWVVRWLAVDVGYKLAVGVAVGWAVGKALGSLLFAFEANRRLADVSGFAALAATLLSYALTELAGGYGFIAVFVTAVVLRHHAGSRHYHEALAHFTEELERLLLAGLLILFGGALDAGILSALTWPSALAGLAIVLLVRPVTGYLALLGAPMGPRHRALTAFFGIRGMGTLYYFTHGLAAATFMQTDAAWALVAWVVLLSILLHGLLSTPAVRWVERSDEP